MQLFIDTANVDDIREAESIGILDGVTTNPTLVAREKRNYRECIAEICSIVEGRPVSAEVIATDAENMIKEAKSLAEIAENIVVKIPMTKDGMKAVVKLTDEGISTNVTLCFSPSQALLAAKAGATYISPFVGRIDDISGMGMDLVRDIVEIYGIYDFATQVITASVRHPIHFYEAALAGSDVSTVPFKIIEQLFKHPLTDIGIERFLDDYKQVPN